MHFCSFLDMKMYFALFWSTLLTLLCSRFSKCILPNLYKWFRMRMRNLIYILLLIFLKNKWTHKHIPEGTNGSFSFSFFLLFHVFIPPNLLWFFKATEGKGNKRTTASHRIRVMNAITTIMNPSWALLWTWHWSRQPWGSRRWGFWKSTTKINNESGKCAGMWWLGCQTHSTHTTELKRRDDMGCQRLLMEAWFGLGFCFGIKIFSFGLCGYICSGGLMAAWWPWGR